MPRSFSKPISLSGGWWRLRAPAPSAAARIYIGMVSGMGAMAIRQTLRGFASRDASLAADLKAADEEDLKHQTAQQAYLVLRGMHTGKFIAATDLPALMMWLAPLLEHGNPERVWKYGRDALYECSLQHAAGRDWKQNAPAPNHELWDGQRSLGALHGDRQAWESCLDDLLRSGPDWTKLALWALLECATPFA